MSAPVRLAAFAMALVIVFLGARAVGSLVGPVAAAPEPADHGAGATHDTGSGGGDEPAAVHDDEGHEDEPAAAARQPGGLTATEAGYTLQVLDPARPGTRRSLRFVVTGPDGEPVTAFDTVHTQLLHLVKIRRDGTGYEHVHPELGDDGTWTARLTLAPGTTRLLADLTPTGGPQLVLGTDVQVPGPYRPQPPGEVAATARVAGYDVRLEGSLVPGASSPLTATVSQAGGPVTDLQPYLGARGHLVALRESDLAYLHVHPDEAHGSGLRFHTEVPGPGRYRLFLEFRHRDRVHTAGFILEAGEDSGHEH